MKNNQSLVTGTGINFPESYTHDEFISAGKFLAAIESGHQWAVGDWYNAIEIEENTAPHDASKIRQNECEKVGLNYNSAHTYALICDSYKFSTRVENLSFKHHQIVMSFDLATRNQLLRDAVKNGWSTRDMARERKIMLGLPLTKTEPPGFDKKVESVLSQLPKSVSNKVRRAIKNVFDELKHNFQDQVETEVKSRLKVDRVRILHLRDEAQSERDAAVRIRTNIDAHMSEKEFKAIRSCLHPDRECSADQKAKAFSLFNSLKDTINDKATSWE